MKVLVVTTLNKKLYDAYGYRFFETYNWPFDCYIYHEGNFDEVIEKHSFTKDDKTPFFYRNIFDEVPDCKSFTQRHKDKPITDFGVKSNDFVKDAVRFCYKVYAYTHAILTSEGYDAVIGIDADSVFYKPIDEQWIKQHIHRNDAMMCYLGRGNHYSECGFLYWNMNHPQTKNYAKYMKDLYDTDYIYTLKEQHDSFVWDYARVRFEEEFGIDNHNIGDGKAGHVQARSVLGEVYDHTKGPRKLIGRSNEARIK